MTVIMFVPMELIDEMKIVKKEIPQMNSQKAQNLLNDLKTEEKEVLLRLYVLEACDGN